MKKIILLFIFIISLKSSIAQSYFEGSSDKIIIQTEFGYGEPNLKNLKHKFRSLVGEYNPSPRVQIQKSYPANGLAALNLYYDHKGLFRLKMGGSYLCTQAYSYYSDYSGSLDIKGNIEMMDIKLGFHKSLYSIFDFRLYAELNGGITLARYSQSVKKDDVLNGRQDFMEQSGSSTGFVVEPAVGIFYRLGAWEFDVNGSYKFSQTSNFEGKDYKDEGLIAEFSGFVIKLGLAYTFKL